MLMKILILSVSPGAMRSTIAKITKVAFFIMPNDKKKYIPNLVDKVMSSDKWWSDFLLGIRLNVNQSNNLKESLKVEALYI